MSRTEKPASFIIWPTNRKNGTARSGKLFKPTHIRWGTIASGTSPWIQITRVDDTNMANAIGTRSRHSPRNSTSRKMNIG